MAQDNIISHRVETSGQTTLAHLSAVEEEECNGIGVCTRVDNGVNVADPDSVAESPEPRSNKAGNSLRATTVGGPGNAVSVVATKIVARASDYMANHSPNNSPSLVASRLWHKSVATTYTEERIHAEYRVENSCGSRHLVVVTTVRKAGRKELTTNTESMSSGKTMNSPHVSVVAPKSR